MPNWRKVIVADQNAFLNSVTTPSGTINDFTASYAINAQTTAINSGTVIEISPASTTWTLNHSTNERYPIVTCWESGSNEIIQPDTVRSIDINTVEVTFTVPVQGFANVSRAGHVISGSQGVTLWTQLTGPAAVTASGLYGGFTGSLQGTASYAINAPNAESASYAGTASIATTASYAVSSSYTFTSSYAVSASYAESASNAISSSYALTASFAQTASAVNPLQQNVVITGSLLVTSSHISTVDWIDFTTGSDQAITTGRLGWDDGNGTLALGLKGGNVTLQVGQEQVARVFNADSVPLTDGMVVYISGSQGNRIAVKRAAASAELGSSNTLGVVTEPIAVGTEGFITTFGVVNGLNTTGYAAGALLWLSTSSGQFTETKPNAPYHNVLVGYVQRVHATVGSIFVKIDNGYELDELHDVLITTPLTGQALVRSGSVWINSNQLDITGSLQGTASWASNAITASNANTASLAVTASHSVTASYGVSASYALSSSYAVTASYLDGAATASAAISASYALSSSYAFSSSYSVTASYANSASNSISSSYALSASQAESASYARTASAAGNFFVGGNIQVLGTASFAYIETTYQTASVIYTSGSTKFGDTADDVMSVTGSIQVSGSIIAPLIGTASFATQASQSFSSSFATQASQAYTASLAVTASYIVSASTATSASVAATASWAVSASWSNTASFATTASWAKLALTASNANTASIATSSSYALSSSFATTASYWSGSIENATSASVAISSSFAVTSLTASYAVSALTASHLFGTASQAVTASLSAFSVSSSYAVTASLAQLAKSSSYINQLNQNVSLSGSLNVSQSVIANSFTGSLNIPNNGTLGIGRQTFFPQGNDGFSVNENFNVGNANQTAYHFTSGDVNRSSVVFSLARTTQFTNMFGVTGSSSENKFVFGAEFGNTDFEWRKSLGVTPVNLQGGTLLARLDRNGVFWASSISGSLTGSLQGTASLATTSSYSVTASYANSASWALTASYAPDTTFPYSGSAEISGSLIITGSSQISGSLTLQDVLVAQYLSIANYSSDAEAAAAGIPLWGIYRTGNMLVVRMA